MVSRDDLIPVGRTQKTHGIRGEIVVLFRRAEYADIDTAFYFLDVEGIPVPFFVEEITFTSDVTARVKFEDVNNEKTASRYVNTYLFLPREEVPLSGNPEENGWDYFVGFTITNQHGETVGTIREVDNTTLNVLFIVDNEEGELLIPATEDFIVSVDEENKRIGMNLPEGLQED